MNIVISVLAYIAARLREPSTWGGIAVAAGLIGLHIPSDAQSSVVGIVDSLSMIVTSVSNIIVLGGSLIAIFKPDRSAALKKQLEVAGTVAKD